MIADPADRGALLAMASLPGIGARRLREVMAHGDPCGEWARIASGSWPRSFPSTADQRAEWRAGASGVSPSELLDRHIAAGVTMTLLGDPDHPTDDPNDPHLPPLLLWRGAVSVPEVLRPPLVGIIGTRRASRYGFDLAREFGNELATAGVCVVSGLAAGIDAAAHRGALDGIGAGAPGGVLAVVGSGLDVVYPASNRGLWAEVAASGTIVSEYPLGTRPAAWRFPARNRILAALCSAVVVVESHDRGGSLITAGIAGARGVPVLAVPGPVRSSGSRGTNRLIADGCQPCLGIDDVFDALGLVGNGSGSSARSAPQLPFGDEPAGGDRAAVLDALGWERRSLTDLASSCPALSLGDLAVALAGLLAASVIEEVDGYYERTTS